jgi:hypothetical protein
MRWTLFSLLLMTATFLVGFIHRDVPHWTWAESLPFSTARAFHAPVLFELALLAQIAVAIYVLVAIRRWRQQAPEIRERPVVPAQRPWVGLQRLIVLIVVNLLAVWAGANMDVGLRFRDVVVSTLGINPNEFGNVAAFCTASVVLATLDLSYLLLGSPRPGPAAPAVVAPGQPAFPLVRPGQPMPPQPLRRP